MAITLNLKHTFTTRVVYSTEQLAELREGLSEALSEGREYVKRIKDPKKKAESLAGIKLTELALSMDDEGMVLFLTREAFKSGVRNVVLPEAKELNVTRMGPLQTEVVG
ncbi:MULTISPECIES: hypothetical protein [unclassified Pseudomonas]|uniref:hypothetical protein n=1 Tax=unclassified Pseudomonas TaxID=196821 RepID=UPI000C8869AC|nr:MULTISPECIES: hypothetical protein [unclassified Pseudomonas]DAF68353.1 MAG TPA: Protein of unknown function (DUF2675) [Caudoviricetes sp.]PMX14141.1 hypothetical protein C1Y25_16170 [Pseudomonas sp. MPBC4-3]PMX46243.1 hypothetical protein C1Y20_17505 [Pseudomonas sp. FW301-21B01]PMY07048.1 hypothetical protein C1Y18_14315 [Pseudomonas sp. MPR-R5A]PNA67900.1 hypothetical protein C1Y14_15735 [Pseudomonas sp. MPR-R5B]